jgi:hypothetical protein
MKTKSLHNKNKQLLITAGILLMLSMSSCLHQDYFPCISATGKKIAETRSENGFDGIDLLVHGQVSIRKAGEYSIVVEAPENIQPYIHTRISGGILVIESERCLRNRIDEIQVFITMPDISTIKVSGSGNVFVEDPVENDVLFLDISGSGKITTTSFSDLIDSRITGSGNLFLLGKTKKHSINISGSGHISSYHLEAIETDVRISGSGHASVSTFENLYVRISGSGNLYYKGNPHIQANITGSGKILRR